MRAFHVILFPLSWEEVWNQFLIINLKITYRNMFVNSHNSQNSHIFQLANKYYQLQIIIFLVKLTKKCKDWRPGPCCWNKLEKRGNILARCHLSIQYQILLFQKKVLMSIWRWPTLILVITAGKYNLLLDNTYPNLSTL